MLAGGTEGGAEKQFIACAAAQRRGGAEEGSHNKPGRFSLPEGDY